MCVQGNRCRGRAQVALRFLGTDSVRGTVRRHDRSRLGQESSQHPWEPQCEARSSDSSGSRAETPGQNNSLFPPRASCELCRSLGRTLVKVLRLQQPRRKWSPKRRKLPSALAPRVNSSTHPSGGAGCRRAQRLPATRAQHVPMDVPQGDGSSGLDPGTVLTASWASTAP